MSRGVRAITGVVAIGVGVVTGNPYLIAMGVSMVGGAVLERKPRTFGGETPGAPVMVRSATEPQCVIYGRTKKSGPLLWFGTSGDLRKYLWFAIAVADGREIDGYEKLWLDDVEIDIATEIDVDGYVTNPAFIDADGNKLVKAKFYRGAAGQTNDAELFANAVEWGADFIGNSTSYFWVRLEIDKTDGNPTPGGDKVNVWAKGPPREIAVTVRGFRVYDPRKDSTAGGSGAHRENSPATWEWSDNPALCIRDFLKEPLLGPGYLPETLPVAHYATQASICDELVGIPGSLTQKRYTVNGWAPTEGEPRPIIESMMTSCQAAYVDAEGVYRVFVGAWNTPEHDIDERWLAGSSVVRPAAGGEDLYNYVRGTYISAAEQWQPVEYPARHAPAYETADGGRRWQRELDLRWTTNGFEAQRLALVELKRGRNQTVVELVCDRRAMVVAEWDVVRLSLSEWGYFEKTFRCIHFADRPDGTILLVLREDSAATWDTSPAELDVISFGDPILREAGRPAPVTALAAHTAPEGIRLAWVNGSMSGVKHVEIYASATNDRTAAALVQRVVAESWTHPLAASTVRYYWALKRGINGLPSAWSPIGATDGVYGIAGAAGQGLPGDPGAPAIEGFASVDGPASWVRDQDGSTWNPAATTTDVDWTFRLDGADLSRISRRVTRAADGLLTVTTTPHPGGDLNTGRVTILVTGGGTRAVTVRATYSHEGKVLAITQGIAAALSGQDGAPGLSVAEIYTYRRSASAPVTPTGGSYNFTTQTLTPPSGWSVSIPAGTDPVYISVTTASIVGATGQDDTLTWSTPVQAFANGTPGTPGNPGADGSGVDIIFRRSAAQPATPSPSTDAPANWYSSVNNVPAGADPLWSSVGTRPDLASPFTWQTPVRIQGLDGSPGINGTRTAILDVYRWAASTPVTFPSGTSTYTWATGQFTAPVTLNGWSLTPPAPVAGQTLYIARQTYADTVTTATSLVAWSTSAAVPLSAAGTDGDTGSAGSSALNVGRKMDRLDQWFIYATGLPVTTWTVETVSGPTGELGLQHISNTTGSDSIKSEKFTLDPTKKHRVSLWAKQPSGDRTSIPFVQFYDAAGAIIGSATSNAVGWPGGVGAVSHNITAPIPFPTSWTLYTLEFGGNATATIPAGAVTMALAGSFAYGGSTSTTVQLQDFRVVELAEDGAHGQRVGVLEIYRWSAAAPATFPSGTSTYTWANGAFTAPGTPNGWSLVPGAAVLGQTLWAASVVVSDNLTTATSVATWNTSTAYPVGYAGTDGINGSNGINGTRTAILDVYRWAASTPVTFPSGTSTYTWATGQFTAPVTLNGWSLTPPAPVAGQTLYIARQTYADVDTSATSVVTWNTTSAMPLSAAGTSGVNGQRVGILEMYRWSAGAPSTYPSGSSTYTWATGAFTAPGTPNSWSLTPGASVEGQTLWGISVVVSNNLTTATTSVTWNSTTVYPVGYAGTNGTNGTNGFNTATLLAYKRAASAPVDNPGTLTYTFATAGWTPGNSWSKTVPAGSNPVWVVAATAYSQAATDEITSGEWSSPVQAFADGVTGASGLNVATVFIYNRTTADSAPANPSVAATYTFATGGITGLNNGWTATVPAFTGANPFLWVTTATASSTGTTDSIAAGEWAAAQKLAQNGADGAAGLSVAELIIYRRAASAPATPTGGSYNFGTQVLTPPTNWSSAIPAGTDPVYTSRAVASIQGTTGTTSSLTWSAPTFTFRDGSDGQAVDIVFRRSAAQPATPAASAGVPVNWYTDVNSVPAGADPLWSSVGTRPNPSTNWTWQTPVKIEGQAGAPGLSVAELVVYRRSASAPATPTGGSFSFTTQVLTPPSGWTIAATGTGTDPMYISRSVASIVGTAGTDSSLTWSTPALAAGIFTPISVDDFAAGIEPVGIKESTPAPGGTYLGTDVVLYAIDGKLYRWNGSAYTKAVESDDIVTITADKIISGVLSAALTLSGRIQTAASPGARIEITGPQTDATFAIWAGIGTKSEANATFYLKHNGDGYFGGALMAGTLVNAATATGTANDIWVEVGPFGTNGNNKMVTVSYSWSASHESASDPGTLNAPTATFRLLRKIGAGSLTQVQTMSITGTTYKEYDAELGLWFYGMGMSGSFTYTDSDVSTSDRTMRAELTARVVTMSTNQSQSLTARSVEE